MKGLIQRVSSASVSVEGEIIGEIGSGMLLFLGIQKTDGAAEQKRMLERVLEYRVFPDDQGRMNRSLRDCGGDLLVVPQFTLAADTNKGSRPSFSSAARPERGEYWFNAFVEAARQEVDVAPPGLGHVATGRFGADMQVQLVNDGPVTFLLAV